MKVTFENLGYIESGNITPGNLTIIAGDNNTGKTYINYTLFGLFNGFTNYSKIEFDVTINELIKNGKAKIDLMYFQNKRKEILDEISKNFKNDLHTVFSTESIFFQSTKIKIDNNLEPDFKIEINTNYDLTEKDRILVKKISNSTMLDLFLESDDRNEIPIQFIHSILEMVVINFLYGKSIKHPFIITSERTGVSLFYKELDINKNMLIEKIAKNDKINLLDLFFQNLSRYPISVKHNIDIIRDIWNYHKKDSFIVLDEIEKYIEISNKLSNMMGGIFKIEENQILFLPNKEPKRKKVNAIPLYLSSSSTKSFLLLYLYLKSIVQKNDILMIDEPELNLHPTNQIKMARFLANLVNLGIDVFITTHSDYMIKEFNNLIMLSNDFENKKQIMKEYDYINSDILTPDKVKAYHFEKHTIKDAKVDNFGIDFKLFDDTIFKINQISNDIYYSIKA